MATNIPAIIVTRHRALVALIHELGLAPEGTPVLEHVSFPSQIRGAHVIGVLPLSLAAEAERVTEIPLHLSMSDREAMTRGDLSLERLRKVAGQPQEYSVRRADDVAAWKIYRRTNIAEMRPYVPGESLHPRVSISAKDIENGSPKAGDMIARNPESHDDQWLVSYEYFAKNFEEPFHDIKARAREVLRGQQQQQEMTMRKVAQVFDEIAQALNQGLDPKEVAIVCSAAASTLRDPDRIDEYHQKLRAELEQPGGGDTDR